ncbi:hypothetical protein POX_b03212 [Penicillium oxalicum]|uniref:hypothetical protein n=1 Tax=Penicillium oxalicum TaxID=69781 RepID=UPI0020B856A7|nr:hypothetical protein POX_b03212 [Penicillium oxalicum]KAI2793162.1 hypothetical protein POX_b03212 [Penicillium oxalicum]
MTFPPPHPSAQSSIASGTDKPSSTRTEIGAWGRTSSQSGTRRGLTPLATNLASSTASSASARGLEAGPGASTPSSFSAVLSASRGLFGASPKPNSAFTPLQSGSQQQAQSLSSPKFRAHTPSGSHFSATTGSIPASGGIGAGGVPASSRGAAFSPLSSGTTVNSPTGFAPDKAGSSTAHSSQSSLTKISIAQVFLLLDSISEKEGKEKWETKAAQIHKLVSSNGMEAFSKYFRRLLTGNAPQIFPGVNKSVENASNYPLLVQEMQKVAVDIEQAQKIAETVDMSEGDIFRDFDLSTFLDHFRLDPVLKVSLALAFKLTSKSDLRAKADAILSNSLTPFLSSLANPSEATKDFPHSFLGMTIERFILYPPRNFTNEIKAKLVYATNLRFQKLVMDMPFEVSSALQMFLFVDPEYALVRQLHAKGPRATASAEVLTDVINAAGQDSWNEQHLASAMLFMVLSQYWQQFSLENLLSAYIGKPINWGLVLGNFDREGLRLDPKQFSKLFDLLATVAAKDSSLDLQKLFGGDWEHRDAQMSLLTAFIVARTDPSLIPSLRPAFPADLFEDSSETVKALSERAVKSPLRCLDAIKAIFDVALFSQSSWAAAESQLLIKAVVQFDLPIFLISALAIKQPWTDVQTTFIVRTFIVFLGKQEEGFQLALDGAWRQDRQWVAAKLFEAFTQDPTTTAMIYEHAAEYGWLEYLLTFSNGLALDLACYCHRKNNLDLEQWVRNAAQKGHHVNMGDLLSKFLRIKAEDELHVQRKEQPVPQMVSLSVKTVYTLLSVLEEYVGDRENLTPVQRICIQTYPRLINYGEGFDDIIDANGESGNSLPEAIDKQMQELFGKMYHEELSLREMLELMRQYKSSREPTEQDLFACMVHGLIDEYHCYHEYPLEALTKTAVMFGGIINFRLVDGITLKVGLGMILEAVREHEVHDPMFKFGVEAIEQLINRLGEWAGFCHLLLQIPTLQGTPIFQKAEEVLREQGSQPGDSERFDDFGPAALPNGNSDDLSAPDGSMRKFRSISVDPPIRSDIYRDPDEDIQDRILFVLNNVSEQNLDEKLRDLRDVLRDHHHQWFAAYLVEERAKLQPNFQQLYLDLLDRIDDRILWAEVLRETYVSLSRLLNSESTLTSSTDRGHLKNLGAWLGSLTIAKDKPIKHKNVYFKGLLLEGYDTQRLMVTIPFTCKVLVQATKSRVFRPPNPWLMDILGLLLELYHFAELKLNLKFEIEVLCKDLDLDHKTIAPAVIIRDRSAHINDEGVLPAAAAIPEGLEPFNDLAIGPLSQGIQNERLSPAAIMSTLPSLEKILVLPPSASSMVDASVLRQIVHTAVERAIAEIITPVVERSVTIASISTVQLVSKDFATEPDEEKVRQAAGIMVRQLAGSLALVTCKEPLKVSMTNYIRVIQQEYSDQPMPEGLVLMCVNDNLDAACGIVEKAAEEKSLPEIEKVIEPQLEARRRHLATRPNEPFVDPSMNRWGLFIPEPYRQMPGGLNKEQFAIYEEFARQSRGPVSAHPQNVSADSGRQIPDVLQEAFPPPIPNLSTPAEQPAIPHRTPQPQNAVTQMGLPSNGFLEAQSPRERVDAMISELQISCRNVPEEHVKDLSRDSTVLQEYNQILRAILASPNGEELARLTSLKICTTLYSQSSGSLEIEVLVHLLAKLGDMSTLISRYTWALLSEVDDEHLFNIPVTVALIDAGLLDIRRVDMVLTRLILQKNITAIELLDNLMSRLLFNDEPTALRSDFGGSLEAMSQWLAEDGNVAPALDIVRKLRDAGIPEVVAPLLTDQARSKRDQMEYIFSEWIGVYRGSNASERTYLSFLQDMHNRQVMNTQEDSTLFFRLSIDISVVMFENESQNPNGSLDEAFLYIDALAKLIVLLIKYQGEATGSVRADKPSYFNSILSALVLVLNNHQVMRGEAFNQRVFFRLFSTILCEYSIAGLQHHEQHQGMIFALANKFLSLQPRYVPGFVYGWLSLISHRVFMSDMLNMPNRMGWAPYCEIMQALLSYIGEQLKAAEIHYVAKDLYKGVLRILLILHHDFPEFVAENHFQFCNVIPAHCAQLRNLVLSAYPSSFQKLPDPFREGLKVERLEEMREIPKIAGDIIAPLQNANIKQVIDDALQSESISDSDIQQICDSVLVTEPKETALFYVPINVDVVLINALTLYIGQQGVEQHASKSNARHAFETSAHATLLEKIAQAMQPEGRYYLLSAMANQLRYPNSHTYFFNLTILRLFGVDFSDSDDSAIRQQIIRVLLERLIVHRPHPWGLIITLQELLQNRSYSFFRLPFIQAAPEIGRLFDALLQHIQQQSPRPVA